MPRLIIGADIVPTKSNIDIFESGCMEEIVDRRLLDLLKQADYRIFNLEVPLTDAEKPIMKCGPNLIASTKSVRGLKQLGIDFFTLANNHILDQGEQGLYSTTCLLEENSISYAGVGRTPTEATKPHIVELDGKRIGIYCCAEHEFSIVSEKMAGANPFDPLESLDHISELKLTCDYVICLYHGGKEHYRYPSPYLQKVCRKMADKGADLVVCQHSHCIGCEEKWERSTIVYGQGNFLFDHSDSEFWKTSLLISLDISSGEVKYIPIQKNGNGVILPDNSKGNEIIRDFNIRSNEISVNGFVDDTYSSFAADNLISYICSTDSIGSSFLFRGLNKLSSNKLKRKLTASILKKHRYGLINRYECEAHRELILKGLYDYE